MLGRLGYASERLESTYAVVVVGERYDVDAAEVLATGAPAAGWFYIACAGSAVAKMKLMGYDPENPHPGFATGASKRQATIKMIVAACDGITPGAAEWTTKHFTSPPIVPPPADW